MKKSKTETERVPGNAKSSTLEDVAPLHPEAYPAKHLKQRLDARRERLEEIEERSHPTGLPEGDGS